MAKPEFKRFSALSDGKPNFCLAVYIPYVGKLVETNKQEAWIRYGDTRHKMSEEEKRDFRSTRQELSFEQEKAAYDIRKDFSLDIIEDFCSNFRARESANSTWTNEDILVDRKLAIREPNGLFPTNALVLLAGLDPSRTIPGCRVRIQRFDGVIEGSGSNYSPLKDRFVEGNVVKIIQTAEKEIETLIYDVTWLNNSGRFETTPEYPKWAWYEALVNACVHRSYSFSGTEITVKLFEDRLEIESPGGFVPPVNELNLYQTRASRNHHFMDAMRYLGYVRMAREGTRRIRETMTRSELPEPIFKQESMHGIAVRVTLYNNFLTRKRSSDREVALFFGVQTWEQLQEYEIQIAAYVYRNKIVNVSDAARITNRTWATSKKDLEKLLKRGILEYVAGAYPRDPSAHYKLKNTS
jgi:ATP-dependent DNA helicase RecG